MCNIFLDPDLTVSGKFNSGFGCLKNINQVSNIAKLRYLETPGHP